MLELLGVPQFNGKPIALERALYLVAVLVCHQTPMARDELMLLLWEDTGDEATIKQRLRQLAYRTKQLPYGVALESNSNFLSYTAKSDVALFRQAIEMRQWQEAISFYKGTLLHGASFDHGELEEWFLLERDTLRAEYVQAALSHAANLEKPEAARLLENTMQHDPQNEELLRVLLEYAKAAPEVGIRAFERYSKLLAQDLGLEPPKELQLRVQHLGGLSPAQPIRRQTLPTPNSAFVGRQAELEEIERLLQSTRLLTLLGVGGIGKTRLSLEVASRSQGSAYFVDLARLNSAELVPSAILETLGERSDSHIQERLEQVLANRKLLLVLDNFEHVMSARDLVAQLLEAHGQLSLIITSRERLGLKQEQVFELGGMPAPDTLFPLESQDAAQIFLRAAQRNQLDFSLQNDVVNFNRIFQAVSGMPLGLELLEHSLDVLSVDAPDMPTRHRSFAAVFGSSWQLLSSEEQGVLAQLAIFRGGFDKDMARRVADASLPVLLKLVNKSLVSRREQRFVLHELVRQYSQAHLSDPNPTLAKLAEVLVEVSVVWKEHQKDERQTEFSKRLENDHDNIRTVLHWALSHDPKTGAILTGNLEHFWYTRGYYQEGLIWANQFAARYLEPDEIRLGVLWTQVSLSKEQSNYDLSRQSLASHKILAEQLCNTPALAGAEKFLGILEREQGNLALGRTHLEKAKAMFEELHDTNEIAICLNDLGIIAAMTGDLDNAKDLFNQSLVLKRTIGDKMGVSYAIGNLGVIAGSQGDFELERVLQEESLYIKRELGDKQGIGNGLQSLGVNAFEQDEVGMALDYFVQSLQIFSELGRRYTQTTLIFDFARCAWKLGANQTALELVAAAIHWRYAIRGQPDKFWFTSQQQWQEKSGLSPAELAQLEFDVQKLTLEQVVQKVFVWKESRNQSTLKPQDGRASLDPNYMHNWLKS
jgi:predicted ATPase/DNA-binding SARP family transcriptional activator